MATSAATTSDPVTNVVTGLALTGAGLLLAPIWYLGFPVTIPLSMALPAALSLLPLGFGAGGHITPVIGAAILGIGLFVFAVAPIALTAAGLSVVLSAVAPRSAAHSAAGKTANPTATTATRVANSDAKHIDDAPASTGHSVRDITGSRRQTGVTAHSRSPVAATAVAQAPTESRRSSKKPTTSKRTADGTKRSMGSSARNR